jgi:hypothetical protein
LFFVVPNYGLFLIINASTAPTIMMTMIMATTDGIKNVSAMDAGSVVATGDAVGDALAVKNASSQDA